MLLNILVRSLALSNSWWIIFCNRKVKGQRKNYFRFGVRSFFAERYTNINNINIIFLTDEQQLNGAASRQMPRWRFRFISSCLVTRTLEKLLLINDLKDYLASVKRVGIQKISSKIENFELFMHSLYFYILFWEHNFIQRG